MERHHPVASGMNQVDGFRRRPGDHVTADDQATLPGERQGRGATYAPAGARDDADPSFKPARHLLRSPCCSGALFCLGDANLIGQLRGFGEVPIDDVEGWLG